MRRCTLHAKSGASPQDLLVPERAGGGERKALDAKGLRGHPPGMSSSV